MGETARLPRLAPHKLCRLQDGTGDVAPPGGGVGRLCGNGQGGSGTRCHAKAATAVAGAVGGRSSLAGREPPQGTRRRLPPPRWLRTRAVLMLAG